MIFDDTRADWNARPPLRALTRVPWAQRIGVSWHWIGPGYGPRASGPHSACLAQVRDWQWQHQHKPAPDGPWKDIGYNGLICPHARAIEGRGVEFSGSHSPGVNVEHVGFQFMCGEDAPFPSAAMLGRARKLRADVGELGPNIRRDWAHRDDPKAQTECPGNALAKWVHEGGPTNQEDDDMPSADEIAAAVWKAAVPIDGRMSPAGKVLGEANLYAYRSSRGIVDVPKLAAAVIASLPSGGSVNVDALAKAIVVELGKD